MNLIPKAKKKIGVFRVHRPTLAETLELFFTFQKSKNLKWRKIDKEAIKVWACDKRSIIKNVSPFWPKSTVILTNTKWPDDFYIVCISLSTKKCPMAKKHIFLCIFFRFYLGLCRLWRWSQPTWLKIEFERYTKKESIFCHWTLVCTYTNTNNIKIIKSFCICQY